jgi:hypothetical protein
LPPQPTPGGAVIDPDGIDVEELIAIKDQGGQVTDYPKGRKVERDAVIDVECEIWIPAARSDVIRADNVDRLCTRLVLQGANIPVTAEAAARLHDWGVLAVPDFIANAGDLRRARVSKWHPHGRVRGDCREDPQQYRPGTLGSGPGQNPAAPGRDGPDFAAGALGDAYRRWS